MTTKKTESATTVSARVLVDCALGKCDQVVEVLSVDLPSLVGMVDADPAAVAYAKSLEIK